MTQRNFGLRIADCGLREAPARCLLLTAFCLLLFLITHHSLLITAVAQSATATLSGTVEDANGAVVPGTTVTATNVATTLRRQTVTNSEGYFTLPLLPPGGYTLRAEHDGFAPLQVENIVLNVGDQKALQIQLKAGDVKAEVQVINDVPLINESPAVGTVIDRQFVANLPLNGRSFQSLINLTPGVVLTPATSTEQGQFSVNGQRANSNYFTVDGVSANIGMNSLQPGQSAAGEQPGFGATGGTNSLVSVDALQEFKIQTSTFAPEFGRTPGAQVQILTRSGANALHGTLFEYFRNDALDANDWFANSRGLKKTAERQNDFGGTFSGPILLPRFGEGGNQPWYNGKDHTFFFFSYEGLRLRVPRTQIDTVPTVSFRQGAAPNIRPLFNAYPLPNGRDFGNGLAEFTGNFSEPSTLNATSIRIDHAVSKKLSLFGRYNYSPSENLQRGNVGTTASNLFQSANKIQTLTIGATQLITATISNDLRINFSKSSGTGFYSLDSLAGAIPPSDSVLFPSFTSSKSSKLNFFPPSGMRAIQAGKQNISDLKQINLVDGLGMTRATHQLKFGIDYRRIAFPHGALESAQNLGLATTLNQLQSGVVPGVLVFTVDEVDLVFYNYSAYAQDTWRASRRLTLTYGLRWDVNPPPKTLNGRPLFGVQGLDNPATIALAPLGTPPYKTTYDNFAPRIGVAYQLSQRKGREMVVRGGFGIFYDLGTGPVADAMGNFPYARSKLVRNAPFPLLSGPDAAPPPFSLTPVRATFRVTDPNLKLPRVFQWNGAVERSLGSNQVVTASYVGAVGRRLLRFENFFFPNPGFVFVLLLRNSAVSDYHAFEFQFDRRLSRGLQALASYTWSHSIDTASNDSNFQNGPVGLVDPRRDRGSSDFDVRHSLSGALTYRIPSPWSAGLGKAVFGSWSLDSIVYVRSATPVDLIGSFNSTGFFATFRPDLIPGIPLYVNDPAVPGGRRFNAAAFRATRGRQGTLGRNVLRGFSVFQTDLALRRQFNLTERVNLQFRAEFFNIFNHPNFGNPSGFQGNFLSSPLFGQSTSMLNRSLGSGGANGGFNPLYQIGGPRSIQFAVKLNF